MSIRSSLFDSPVGAILITASAENITSILFAHSIKRPANADFKVNTGDIDTPLIRDCKEQLQQYFDGKRFKFELPIQQDGSAFRQNVWAALLNIPYGKTISYLELSKRIGNIKAIRAVGTTNGHNNISIIVPCHRVIGSNGSLTGYGGDLWRKRWLLDHEASYANGVQTLF